MVFSRGLNKLRTTGRDVFGRGLNYTRLRSSDQEEKDDAGYRNSSPEESISRSSQDVSRLSSPGFDLLSKRLEDGSGTILDQSIPFLRPLQPERRGLSRRARIWIAPLAGLIILLTITFHRLASVNSHDSRKEDGLAAATIVTNSTEAPASTSGGIFIDDPPETPEFQKPPRRLGLFLDGSLTNDTLTTLDNDHRSVSDALALRLESDGAGRPRIVPSPGAANLYVVVEPDQHLKQPKTYPTLRPVAGLSGRQLETWFLYGFISKGSPQPPLPPAPDLDFVMTWVNGSDPLWGLERNKQAVKYGLASRIPGLDRHWRDNGMGAYPVRSIVDAFSRPEGGTGGLRRIHLVTADVRPDGIEVTGSGPIRSGSNSYGKDELVLDGGPWSIGQVPSWLNQSELVPLLTNGLPTTSSGVDIQWHFHSEAFQLPESFFGSDASSNGTVGDTPWNNVDEWKREALPTYNSFAIEWQLGWLDGVNDLSVHMNDDMLLLAPMSTADFYSVPYGSVLRIDPTYQLRVTPKLDPTKVTDTGEWGGLQYANYLLSQRFPDRGRHYLHHLPKTLSKPIVHEAMHMFCKEVAMASSRPFREANVGQGDIEMGFMVTHLRIERWREALLWLWAVGKMGHLKTEETGIWGEAARVELKSLLGTDTLSGTAIVVKEDRDTLKSLDLVFEYGKWDKAKSTSYSFSSMDGHLEPLQLWPREGPEICQFKVEKCLGEAFMNGTETVSASDMFKRLAFEEWKCGDCLINALVNRSGKTGLSAFFPPDDLEIKNATVEVEVAHLPLTSHWRQTDFSIEAVTKGASVSTTLNLRNWGMKMLSRYLYVIGDTPSHFVALSQASQTTKVVTKLDVDRSIAMVCFNDDATKSQKDKIAKVVSEWLSQRFQGKEVYWERHNSTK